MEEKNDKGYVVRIAEGALITIFLSAMEAYAIEHLNIKSKGSRKKSLECVGSLFGYEVLRKNKETLYQVEFASVDTSSEQKTSEVTPNKDATRLKIDVLNSFWPHLDYLGEFHSHPNKSYKHVIDIKDYHLSDGKESDKDDFINDKFWLDIPFRIAMVVAIASMERKGTKACSYISNNCVEATLGNFKIWLTVYCAYLNKDNKLELTADKDKKVVLDCPSLTGLEWEDIDFGKMKNGKFISQK